MKSTGIIRRIDELGRIVIPKEIRKKMKIKNGDELEFYVDNEDNIILKKYLPFKNMFEFANNITKLLFDMTELTCVMVDTDTVISCTGNYKKELIDNEISDELLKVLVERNIYASKNKKTLSIIRNDDLSRYYSQLIMPIIVDAEVIGGVILLSQAKGKDMSEQDAKILKMASAFVSMQVEN